MIHFAPHGRVFGAASRQTLGDAIRWMVEAGDLTPGLAGRLA